MEDYNFVFVLFDMLTTMTNYVKHLYNISIKYVS